MSALTEFRLFHEGVSTDETTSGGGKFLVIADPKLERFFREWLRLESRTKFLWVSAVSCARPFPPRDRVLAEALQKFILDRTQIETVLCVVEKERLLAQVHPAPRPIIRPVRPQLKIVDLKKSLRDYRT